MPTYISFPTIEWIPRCRTAGRNTNSNEHLFIWILEICISSAKLCLLLCLFFFQAGCHRNFYLLTVSVSIFNYICYKCLTLARISYAILSLVTLYFYIFFCFCQFLRFTMLQCSYVILPSKLILKTPRTYLTFHYF